MVSYIIHYYYYCVVARLDIRKKVNRVNRGTIIISSIVMIYIIIMIIIAVDRLA